MGNCFSWCRGGSRDDSPPPRNTNVTSEPRHAEYERRVQPVHQESYQRSGPVTQQPIAFPDYRSAYLDDEREEAEHLANLARQRDGFRQKQNDRDRRSEEEKRDRDQRAQRQFNEQSARLEEEKRRLREENERKNRKRDLETELRIREMKANAPASDADHNRIMEELQAESRRLDDQFYRNQLNCQQKQMERELERHRNEYEGLEKRQRLQDEYDLKREEIHRENDQKRREMNRQVQESQDMLNRSIWNDKIEKNWTARLNGLRSANKESENLAQRCLQSNPSPHDLSQWKYSLESLKNKMDDESRSMSEMYQETGKSFLLEIKSSVDRISADSSDLLDALNHHEISRLKDLSRKLNKSCLEVPTLAELKRNYNAEMRNNSRI
uniref:Uncharacterized protein n=1 Tax=Caenorhabditis tropicalis TaxID=1561998 RepID=A0A1I7UBA9_9PELO